MSVSEKRYRIPQGMYKAAMEHQDSEIQCGAALHKVIEWLARNPITPTVEQARELWAGVTVLNETSIIYLVQEWQRGMFLEPMTPEQKMRAQIDQIIERHGLFPAELSTTKTLMDEAYLAGVAAAAERK